MSAHPIVALDYRGGGSVNVTLTVGRKVEGVNGVQLWGPWLWPAICKNLPLMWRHRSVVIDALDALLIELVGDSAPTSLRLRRYLRDLKEEK